MTNDYFKGDAMITIEAAESKNIPQVLELWWKLMRYHVPFEPMFEGRPVDAKLFEQRFSDRMEAEELKAFMAMENDEIIGCTWYVEQGHPPVYTKARYGYIMGMMVKPGHRRSGVGTMMLEKIYKWAESEGLDRLEVQIVPGNEAGYSFWKKQGYDAYMHVAYKEI